MSSNKFMRSTFAHRRAARGLVIAAAVSAGGCSADVTRFDFPAFALNSNGPPPATGSLAPPPQPVARSYQRFDEPPSGPPPQREANGGSGTGAGEELAPVRERADQPSQPRVAVASTTDRFTISTG
jgi:hypothetical protein